MGKEQIYEITAKEIQKLRDTLAKKYSQVKRLHEANEELKRRCHELSNENSKLWQRLEKRGVSVEAITKPTSRRRWKACEEELAA